MKQQNNDLLSSRLRLCLNRVYRLGANEAFVGSVR